MQHIPANGPVVGREWNPFTAKMIHRSGATVLPIRFQCNNTRLYQIANQLSATIRQGLLIHEVVNSLNKPQRPVVGMPIEPAEMERRQCNPRTFMEWLRDVTLKLEP